MWLLVSSSRPSHKWRPMVHHLVTSHRRVIDVAGIRQRCLFSTNTSSTSPWKVAVVGSGPSGCYTAKYLEAAFTSGELPERGGLQVDILDRLPTAYGLVRNGVAPDHPEVKNVQNDFDQLFVSDSTASEKHGVTAGTSKISFFGNVTVGRDVSLRELRERYDVVVLAYGCESDRSIDIPGADLDGILSAREFVAWYNGHVDYEWVGEVVQKNLSKNAGASTCNIVVIGHGNVALDCARILAKTREELDPTDLATRALNICAPKNGGDEDREFHRHISIVGRRGHVQAAFTIKEARELTKLPNANFVVRPDELEMGKATEASQEELQSSRPKTRIDKLLTKTASNELDPTKKPFQVDLRFLMHPIRFESDSDNTLSRVICERTQLVGETDKQQARGTGEEEAFDADLALVSIGYKGVAIEGTEPWFDASRGVLTNTHGLVDQATTEEDLGGLYVAGWLKRGPSGIIGTNIPDAKDTVVAVVKELNSLENPTKVRDAKLLPLSQLLEERGVNFVDWEAYQRIESAESNAQHKRHPDQPREKIVNREELLKVASPK